MNHTILTPKDKAQVKTESMIFLSLSVVFALLSSVTEIFAQATPQGTHIVPIFLALYALAFAIIGAISLFNYFSTQKAHS